MATNYSPDGQPLPLALGNFGTTQSTVDPATRTPTMAESQYYNWATHGQTQPDYMRSTYDFNTGGYSQPAQPVYGGPTTPQGYNAPSPSRGGGYSINSTGNFIPPVPSGQLWQRYQAIQANPNVATADPAYQFLFNQGQEALNRTAAARRMRFAGKTMLDAQNFGQGLAASNLRTILGELRAGAGDEYQRAAQQAQAQYQLNSAKAFSADPYGAARRAGSYDTIGSYMAANPTVPYDKAATLWQQGRKLNQSLGF